ncbi:MAG: PIG-L deacetylase family protein [Anaerolineales bacterium]
MAMRHERQRLLIPLILFVGTITGIFFSVAANKRSRIPVALDLQPIDLAAYHHIMIFAPHCDDETLGAGGLIQLALKENKDVTVVMETNGDGYLFATMEEFRRFYPRSQDFINMGSIRQQETLNALKTLGLSAEHVIFLGYPDRGTPALWLNNWGEERPFTSPYTRTDRSPYPRTFDPQAVYAGQDLLGDIRTILETHRPDLIIFPNPSDVHPDHWGLSAFVRLAVYLMQQVHPDYQPALYGYLVHRPDYPSPKGYYPQDSLMPPLKLWSIDVDWWKIDLPSEDINTKERAIFQYRSQLTFLRTLLVSFVRTNELFNQPEPTTLPVINTGDPLQPNTWESASLGLIAPVQEDPLNDFVTRQLIPASDLVGLYAAETPDNQLWMCAALRGATNPLFTYSIKLLAVDGKGVQHHFARSKSPAPGMTLVKLKGKYACDSINLADLGNPWLIFMSADVNNGNMPAPFGPLDQTAWQAVYLKP